MKISIIGFVTLCTCLFSICLSAEDNIRDNSTGEVFPQEISFEHNGKQYQLQATGVTTRKKLIIKVYSIAHYLQKNIEKPNADKIQEILSDDYAKQLTMKWVRDVTFDNLQETYRESFRKVFTNQEYATRQGDIDTYIKFFKNGAHRGEEFVLRWLPGGYVEVLINGEKVGSITNKEFAKGLWSIWFGNKSVVNRQELISLMK